MIQHRVAPLRWKGVYSVAKGCAWLYDVCLLDTGFDAVVRLVV